MKRAALPLISCIMLTQRVRLEMAKIAIDCFRAQTYPEKQLVVVAEDPVTIEPLLKYTRNIMTKQPPGLTLGDYRNLGIELAAGELVATWDDDDWHHPARLEQQHSCLTMAGAEACVLSREYLAWPDRDLFTVSPQARWENSLLARRAILPPYPSLQRGSDTPVVDQLETALLDAPYLYIRRVHGQNVWPEDHFVPALRWERLSPLEVVGVKKALRL